MKAKLMLGLLGVITLGITVPRLVEAATTLKPATANGTRDVAGNINWVTLLQGGVGDKQTPVPPAAGVCFDGAGTYTAMTSDGKCPPGGGAGQCCQLVMLLLPPQGVSPAGYPHPGTKGDCPSCQLPGQCIVSVTPPTGPGPVQANRACD